MDSPLSIEELIQDFDESNLIEWTLFSQAPGLKVYRRSNQKLFQYKCFTHLPDISPEISYKVTYDIEYRLIWDKYLKEGRKISDGDEQGIYWQIAMPLFIDNRDYTFVQETREFDIDGRHFYYILTRSEQFSNEPPREKVVRVESYQSQTIICSDDEKGFKSMVLYYEDPRGSFSKAIWDWAAKFGIPIYAKLIHNAYKAYPEWLKDKKTIISNVLEDDIDSAAATAAAAAVIMPASGTVDNEDQDDDDEKQDKQ